MTIAFICGSLEHSCDGVGDYTRRLAGELAISGHNVAITALYDWDVASVYDGQQDAGGIEIPVLRLPKGYSATIRFNIAKKWVEQHNPDWISLQYVPFSFHPKGVSIKLNSFLKRLGIGRKWHIMFHELWVGMEIQASGKYILYGYLQKLLILNLITKLKPAIIHTQCRLYQQHLAKLYIDARFLPLFSNIPLVCDNYAMATKLCLNDGVIPFVLFGTIHAGAPVEDFVNEVALFAKKFNLIPALRIVGHSGKEQKRWVDLWQSAGLPVEVFGEQTAERISEILLMSTIGIATTPYALLEKSGSVAALREHGLSILAVSNPWMPKGIDNLIAPEGVIRYEKGNLESCISIHKKLPYSSVHAVSNVFIDDLLHIEK